LNNAHSTPDLAPQLMSCSSTTSARRLLPAVAAMIE